MHNVFSAVFGAVLIFSTCALAGETNHSDIVVEQAWARASAGAAKSGAAYVTLSNHGEAVDRLMAIRSPVADRVEVHTHVMTDNVMYMMKVEGGVEVEPGSPTVFKPGGLHIMFMGLNQPFVEGKTLPITLVFEKAGKISVEVSIQSIGAMEPMQEMSDQGHKHGS